MRNGALATAPFDAIVLVFVFLLDQNAFIGGWLREVGSRMGLVVYLEPTKGGTGEGWEGRGGWSILSIQSMYVCMHVFHLCGGWYLHIG